MNHCDLLSDVRCTLGEGIVWDTRRDVLWWTDIQQSLLWRREDRTGEVRQWALPDRLGALAVCASGKLLLALAKSLHLASLDEQSGQLSLSRLIDVEATIPTTRTNDGRTDREGNFVFGTMNEAPGHAPIGSFYQFSIRRGLRRLDLGTVGISNSICFSLDGRTMYFCDSQERRIMRCEYDAGEAAVRNVQPFVVLGSDQGMPDGSIVDAEGCLWNAVWGEGLLRRYRADGSLERTIAVPARNPTCVAFGGPALTDLFVTSSRQEMSEADLAAVPHAGAVYHASPGVTGVADALVPDA